MKQRGMRRESFHYSHARRGRLRTIPDGLAVVLSATRLGQHALRFAVRSFSLSWAGRGRDPTSSP
jgi:hypothetical protein